MRMILPEASGELGDLELAQVYAYPAERWLRANMVSSADGAGVLQGKSAGLSSPGDMRLFGILRVLADVVLVGAGTARAEEYKPARRREELSRLRDGRPAAPPIAVVSRSLGLDLSTPLFAQAPAEARTIVITSAASPPERRADVGRTADVIVAGDDEVDLAAALAALAERGLSRVICEGGPHLLGQLAGGGLLDELCLTLSPLLAGPELPRIVSGTAFAPQPMTLAGIAEESGFLFCRYRTTRD